MDVSCHEQATIVFRYALPTGQCDGGRVKASDLNGVQSRIRQEMPTALFNQCFGHRLNLVLSTSLTSLNQCFF